ncbi:hypothetical protein PYW08_001296 [Mythimna loreyi]|uniref:Uncharacterized protein n=1 Tax=Mythimna loreyi TaxID=667449 RepID=A0ACC2R0Y8_9NEOP|nr:hypothetical protein PYW08_001296 [Mythimna loreyi]
MPSNKKLIKCILSALDEKRKHKRRHRRRHTNKSRTRSRSPTRRLSTPSSDTTEPKSRTPSPDRERLEDIPPEVHDNPNTDTTEMEPINPYKEDLDMEYEEPQPYNGQIHKDIKLNHILTNGLTKEERDTITKKHSVPDNCTFLDAPLLNPEVKAVLTESSKLRDHGIEVSQKQVGLATSIIAKCMTELITTEETNKKRILANLADAAKLLANTHFYQTQTRVKLISPLLDKNLNQILSKTKRDSFLYGENLPELLKNLKQMQQVAAQLKKPNPAQSNTRPNSNNPKRPRQGNRNGPPPKTNMKTRGGPRKNNHPTNQQHPRWKQHSERAYQQGRHRNAPANR